MSMSRSAPVARYTDSDRRAGTPPKKRASNNLQVLGKWPSPAISLPPASPHLDVGRRFAGGHSPTSSIYTCLARVCRQSFLRVCLWLGGSAAQHSTAQRTALHGDTQHGCMLASPSYPIEPPARSISAQPSPAQPGACRSVNRQRREQDILRTTKYRPTCHLLALGSCVFFFPFLLVRPVFAHAFSLLLLFASSMLDARWGF